MTDDFYDELANLTELRLNTHKMKDFYQSWQLIINNKLRNKSSSDREIMFDIKRGYAMSLYANGQYPQSLKILDELEQLLNSDSGLAHREEKLRDLKFTQGRALIEIESFSDAKKIFTELKIADPQNYDYVRWYDFLKARSYKRFTTGFMLIGALMVLVSVAAGLTFRGLPISAFGVLIITIGYFADMIYEKSLTRKRKAAFNLN